MKRFALIVIIAVSSLVLGSCAFFDGLFGASPLLGSWAQQGSWSTTGGTYQAKVEFIYQSQNSFVMNFYGYSSGWVLTDQTEGSYFVRSDIITMNATSQKSLDQTTGALVNDSSFTPETMNAKYSISGNTMTLTVDYNNDGVYDTTHTFANTFPSGGGPLTDLTYDLTKE